MDRLSTSEESSLWNISFHLHLNEKDLTVLHAQAAKLVSLSETASSWQSGSYAQFVDFHDESTRVRVRAIWQFYSNSSASVASNTMIRPHFENTMKREDWHNLAESGGMGSLYDRRSTMPIDSVDLLLDIRAVRQHYSQYRSLATDKAELVNVKLANPTLVSGDESRFLLDWTTQPFSGFHMANRYISHSEQRHYGEVRVAEFVAEAQKQFKAWIRSFREQHRRMKIVAAVSDSLTFADSLIRPTGGNLDDQKPKLFNVIDTAMLIDYYGAISLLVHVIPLLEQSPSSTLLTDLIHRDGQSHLITSVSSLLYGDLKTMSLLLGLQLIDSWTNLTFVAPTEEYLMVSMTLNKMQAHDLGEYHHRLAWKPVAKEHSSLRLQKDSMVGLLFKVWTNMFAKDDFTRDVLRSLNHGPGQRPTEPQHTKVSRATFAELIGFLKSQHECDWESIISSTVHKIETNDNSTDKIFVQELVSHLHQNGLYTPDAILRPAPHIHADSLQRWGLTLEGLPDITYVTLKIPRRQLKPIEDLSDKPINLETPFVQVYVSGSENYFFTNWEHHFACLQICFGDFRYTGKSNDLTGRTVIRRDPRAWASKSPMLVTFSLPTWLLLKDPAAAVVGLVLRLSSAVSPEARNFSFTVPDGRIFHTKLEDRAHVALSQSAPSFEGDVNQAMSNLDLNPSPAPATVPLPALPPVNSGSFLALEVSQQHVARSLTARVEVTDETALKALRNKCEVCLGQLNPFCLTLALAGVEDYNVKQRFPLPVSSRKSRLRIARTSGYIEIIAVVNRLDEDVEQDDAFITCNRAHGVLSSVPYLNLDLQPSVSLACSSSISGFVRLQYSEADASSINRGPTISEEEFLATLPRLQLRTTLMFAFDTFVGNGTPREAALAVKRSGSDHLSILILFAGLRLDSGNRTPLLDAAVIDLNLTRFDKNVETKLMDDLTEKQDGVRTITVSKDTLGLLHKILPAFAERCRRWKHQAACSFVAEDVSTKESSDPAKDIFCACGRGVFPKSYPIANMGWKDAKKYATRVAISPVFFVPFLEKSASPETILAGL